MAMKKLQKKRHKIALRPLLGAMLVASGLFRLAVPTLGQTAAGTNISNTATAEYEDDNNNRINATSNTVDITVAEVAGITVVPAGFTDQNGGSVDRNDTLFFDFEVTNVGNANTTFFIPGATALEAVNVGNTITSVEVIQSEGVTLTTPETVNAAGSTTGAGGFLDGTANAGQDGIFAPGESLIVRVTVTVDNTVNTTDPVTVQFGDTPPNDNSAGTQNQPLNASATPNLDVNTIDPDPAPGGQDPVNGQREAAAIQTRNVGNQPNNLALTRLEKNTVTVTTNLNTTARDDVITYGLSLTVQNTDPSGQFNPAPLEGTEIQLDQGTGAAQANRILVSDVIPTGTVLTGVPTAPANWTVVYSVDDPNTTTPVEITGQTAAIWLTNPPADLTTVRRVGFIFDPATNGNLPANGTPITGFQFDVLTSGLPINGGTVNNISQVFGQTFGDVNNEIVYDESGDRNPNNFNDNNQPPDATGTNYAPDLVAGVDTGIANPNVDGVDPGGNNGLDNNPVDPSGIAGGEVNQVQITANPVADNILNGPNGFPGAIGPVDQNDDFTNQSTLDNPLNDAGAFDPAPVVYTNTVQNPVGAQAPLENISLLPLSTVQADAATANANLFGVNGNAEVNGDIPTGTRVIIEFDQNNNGNFNDPDERGIYEFDGTNFNFVQQAGGAPDPLQDSNLTDKSPTPDGIPDPINIAPDQVNPLNPGQTRNYRVTIDLPAGTNQNLPVPIPIVAYVENGTDVTGFDPAQDTTFNFTIDRLYTGYLQLIKEARILRDVNGTITEVQPFSSVQPFPFQPQPGDFIEYRIRYNNISEAPVGQNNVTLNANNIVITEDGTGTAPNFPSNNWGLDNNTPADGVIDTSNIVGTSSTTLTDVVNSTATINFFSGTDGNNPAGDQTGTTQLTDVTKYTVNINRITPQNGGTFTFRRRIN